MSGTPQGSINEAISTLDHHERPDLGSAVKELWVALAARERQVREARERIETEWHNGNMSNAVADTLDALLSEPPTTEGGDAPCRPTTTGKPPEMAACDHAPSPTGGGAIKDAIETLNGMGVYESADAVQALDTEDERLRRKVERARELLSPLASWEPEIAEALAALTDDEDSEGDQK